MGTKGSKSQPRIEILRQLQATLEKEIQDFALVLVNDNYIDDYLLELRVADNLEQSPKIRRLKSNLWVAVLRCNRIYRNFVGYAHQLEMTIIMRRHGDRSPFKFYQSRGTLKYFGHIFSWHRNEGNSSGLTTRRGNPNGR